jgi:hypothetical protein
MKFNYCNWVSTQWQWLVNFKKIINRELFTKGETIHKTIKKHRIYKIENTHKTRKQTYNEY